MDKIKKKPFGPFTRIITDIQLSQKNALKFDIDTYASLRCNTSNIVPIIIDFYVKEADLKSFYERYNNHKLVIVTSREVYDYLIMHKCPIRIEHLPLSLPDKYKSFFSALNRRKKYDLVVAGRMNSVFTNYLKIYKEKHPDFYYVYPNNWVKSKLGGIFQQSYISSKNEEIGIVETREDYFNLVSSSRIALYSTPGIDADVEKRKGWNQVTPRFLEFLACGCHVLCRYESNSDTMYYELEKYWPSVDDYETFEKLMDRARSTEIDKTFYNNYLSKHCTSNTIDKLKKILQEI